MKRIFLFAVLVLVVVQFAGAQFSIGGGAQGGISLSSFPDPVKDYYGLGFGGGAHLDLNVLRYLTIRLRGDYDVFPSDKSKFATAIAKEFTVGGVAADPAKTTFDGLNTSGLGITLSGIGKLPTKSIVTPYALVGLGVHILNASNQTISYTGHGDITQSLIDLNIISQPESTTKFGLNFGAGAEFALGTFKLFIEFQYVIIFTPDKNTSHMPITIGFGI
jgi:opacity protein-like surface antigen